MDDIPGHSICAVACTLSRDHASSARIVGSTSCSNKWFGEVSHAILDVLNFEWAGPKPLKGVGCSIELKSLNPSQWKLKGNVNHMRQLRDLLQEAQQMELPSATLMFRTSSY